MLWKLFGSEYRVNKALLQKTTVQDISPQDMSASAPEAPAVKKPFNWMDIAYGRANEDMEMAIEMEQKLKQYKDNAQVLSKRR